MRKWWIVCAEVRYRVGKGGKLCCESVGIWFGNGVIVFESEGIGLGMGIIVLGSEEMKEADFASASCRLASGINNFKE